MVTKCHGVSFRWSEHITGLSGQREVAFPAYWEGWLNHMQKEHVYRDGRNSYCHLCKFSTTTALFRSRVMNAQCLSIIEHLFFTCDWGAIT